MPRRSRRPYVPRPAAPARPGHAVCIAGGLAAGLLGSASAALASASAAPPEMGRPAGSPALVADLGLHRAPRNGPPVARRTANRGGPHQHRHHVTSGRRTHATDTGGGDGTAGERDLALAATWRIEPALLVPQAGDSSATLAARSALAAVAGRLRVVMGRYRAARSAADDAARAAARSRARLQRARVRAAAAHRVYVRDHRLLAQLITTSYEEGPLTALEFVMAADDADELAVRMGTMQQLGSNEASIVSDAQQAAAEMRSTAAAARRDADAARAADRLARHTLARATDAGRKVLHQLDTARQVLTRSVLVDQMQASLADAVRYADQLPPHSVSFPLPAGSGFYDNHNWGQVGARWTSFHTGDDYSVACGTPVLAATAGRIEILTDQPWSGQWLVMVSTGRGTLTTWYAHMAALVVKPGRRVKAGQVIGAVGNGGNATGCHLHFELHPDGGSIYQDTTDPDPWLKAVHAYPGS